MTSQARPSFGKVLKIQLIMWQLGISLRRFFLFGGRGISTVLYIVQCNRKKMYPFDLKNVIWYLFSYTFIDKFSVFCFKNFGENLETLHEVILPISLIQILVKFK